jgi:predicted HTH domain antitoxin
MSFYITDEVWQKISMTDKQLKQEIAILLFEQQLFSLEEERFSLEKASNFAEVNLVDFKRIIVISNIRTFIKQLNYSQEISIRTYDDSENKSIDFGPIDWHNTNCGKNDETLFQYIYFKFDYTEDEYIKIKIGPGKDQDIRNRISDLLLQKLNNSEFVQRRKSKKWTTRYKRPILRSSDYEDDIQKIMQETQAVWQDFIENDFVIIKKIITENKEYIIHGNSLTSS